MLFSSAVNYLLFEVVRSNICAMKLSNFSLWKMKKFVEALELWSSSSETLNSHADDTTYYQSETV